MTIAGVPPKKLNGGFFSTLLASPWTLAVAMHEFRRVYAAGCSCRALHIAVRSNTNQGGVTEGVEACKKRMIYQDHQNWLSNFDSMPIFWNTVITKSRLNFATDERRILSGKAFHMVFCGRPWIGVSFVASDHQWASQNTLWKLFPTTILRSSVEKKN